MSTSDNVPQNNKWSEKSTAFTAECSFIRDSTNIDAISAVKAPTRIIPKIKEIIAEIQPTSVFGGSASNPEIVKMAIVDANQDPACLAANACLQIMQKNKLSPEDIIFRNISLNGVWLTMWLRGRNSTKDQRASVYNELRNYVIEGKMHAQIEATYTLENIKDAVEHAMRQRNGKIIILPNG